MNSMLRRIPPALVLIALCLWAPSSRAQELPREMEKIFREEKLAGGTWSLVAGDRTLVGAAGSSNLKAKARMRAENRIHIGSVTKTLLAVGLMRLATEGRLDLDAPVSKLVPEIHFDNPWEATHPVRVRHLLDHTAGLENLRIWQMFSKKVGPDDPLLPVFRRDPSVLRVGTPPGEVFSYSNIGYGLAGLVIERVTGERYENWLDRNMLAPLRMHDSTFGFVSQVTRPDARLAWGHGDDLTLHEAMPVALRPAAQFTTSAADMASFARFLMSDGLVDGRPFVRAELLRAMGQPHGTAAARAGLRSGYALGLTLRDREEQVGRCHSGNIVGYRAMFCIYPEQQKAYFYSINTDGENADYGRFDRLLTKALQLGPTAPLAAAAPAPDIREWSGHYVPLVSGIVLERYTDHLFEGVTLALDGKRPMLLPGEGEPRALVFAGGHLFRASDRTVPSHAVLHDSGGRRILSDGVRSFRAVSEWLIWGLWTSLALGLAAFLYVLLAAPFVAWKSRRSPLQPAAVTALSILSAGLMTASHGFASFGDLTVGSAFLSAATLLLPFAVLWQGLNAAIRHYPSWKVEVVACAALLQWCAVLAIFGLLPLTLWR
jgi:CubicO group peptidase (beta-lactamase class C family)